MYHLVTRYLSHGDGWMTFTTDLKDLDYETAGRRASDMARVLDDRFGDDHFWTVTLRSEHGDMFQLFHGRLS